MKVKNILIPLLIFGLSENFINAKFPSYIPVCGRNDPLLSDCIYKSIISLQPYLARGMKELDVPPAEPFFIKSLAFGNDKSLKVALSNVFIKGGTNFQIEKLRSNIKILKFDFLLVFPHLEVTAKYKSSMNFLGALFSSDGDLFTALDNAKARIGMKAQIYNKNGQQYIKFEPISIKVNYGSVKVLKMSNLFSGNPVLSEVVQSLLLSNADFLLNDIYPHVERSFSEVFTEIANKITRDATFDELFPQK